jgi:peroxiredoxin
MKRILSTILVPTIALLFTLHNGYSNNKAPYFELKDLSGKTVRLTDFLGKVVILDFWATWCPPCKKEIPDFIDLYKKYSNQGVAIIGIALDDYESVKKFSSENKINYTILMGTDDVAKRYGGIRGIPTTYVIGKDGFIRQRFEGFRPKEIFENEIKNAIIK